MELIKEEMVLRKVGTFLRAFNGRNARIAFTAPNFKPKKVKHDSTNTIKSSQFHPSKKYWIGLKAINFNTNSNAKIVVNNSLPCSVFIAKKMQLIRITKPIKRSNKIWFATR